MSSKAKFLDSYEMRLVNDSKPVLSPVTCLLYLVLSHAVTEGQFALAGLMTAFVLRLFDDGKSSY